MAGDIAKSDADGADEVLGDHWPTDSESAANDASKEQLRQAGLMEEAARQAGQGRDYAMQEMSGEAAEGIATKFGIHVGEFNDRVLQHQYTAGWLALLGGAIATAKTAMNAAVASHESVHSAPTAFWTFLGEPIGADSITQDAKDESMNSAKAAVQEAAQTLETTKSNIALAIESGQKPPLVPQVPASSTPPPTNRDVDTGGGAPSDFPSGVPASPGASSSGPAAGGPATAPAASAPAASAGGGGAPSVPPPTLGGADMAAPSASSASPLGGGQGAGSPMSGSPMGGMPSGMPQMSPPQMPQMPSQTPGNDLAKTVGDTVGKLAGKDGGQPVDAATLDKLIAAQGDGSGGGLGDEHGAKKDGEKGPEGASSQTSGATTGAGSGGGGGGGGAGGGTPTSPYSASNMNPALNNPQVAGPPSPAAPTVTAAPPSVAAPVTELSGDESAANRPYPVSHTAADVGPGASTHTSAAQNNPYGPGQNGQQPGQGAAPMMGGGGGALGAYPPGGAGFAPMPPPAAAAAPMASAMGSPAVPAAAVTAAGAAAAPMIVPAATNTSAPASEAVAGLNSGPERIAVLPPEHAVAHEHLAGVVKAFRDCPGMAWTTVRVAIGVFLHEEPGLPSRRVRYILATTDGLSLIPMDVKLPAGVELLSGLVDASGSFASDWNGNERPALKLVSAADFYPEALGRLDYLLSNDTTDGIVAPAKASDVAEVVQSKTQTDALIATGKASTPALSRTSVDSPLIPPQKAAEALEAFGKAWKFNDGTPDDLKEATTRLWATRWGAGNRRLERPDDYPAILATYFYVEGMDALSHGRLDDAAYSAYALARINP